METTPVPGPSPIEVLARQTGTFWWAVAGTVFLAIGAFGPWAKALLASKSGIEGDGVLILGAAGAALALLWGYAQRPRRGAAIGTLLVALAAAAVAAIDLADIQSKGDVELFGERVNVVQPGWGIYMVLVAAAVLAIASLVLWTERDD